jgi:hypothetical protein
LFRTGMGMVWKLRVRPPSDCCSSNCNGRPGQHLASDRTSRRRRRRAGFGRVLRTPDPGTRRRVRGRVVSVIPPLSSRRRRRIVMQAETALVRRAADTGRRRRQALRARGTEASGRRRRGTLDGGQQGCLGMVGRARSTPGRGRAPAWCSQLRHRRPSGGDAHDPSFASVPSASHHSLPTHLSHDARPVLGQAPAPTGPSTMNRRGEVMSRAASTRPSAPGLYRQARREQATRSEAGRARSVPRMRPFPAGRTCPAPTRRSGSPAWRPGTSSRPDIRPGTGRTVAARAPDAVGLPVVLCESPARLLPQVAALGLTAVDL